MRERYELSVTRYICSRPGCKTPIDVPSESISDSLGVDLWCPQCEDLASARDVGRPAEILPKKLQLLKGFELSPVPKLEPSIPPDSANLLYRPYTKRSFLRQYIDWLVMAGFEPICDFKPGASCFKKFDAALQQYLNEVDCEIVDECGAGACRFLRSEALKPLHPNDAKCRVLDELCNTSGDYGLCQTGDEAQLLQNYIVLTGSDHYPMLVPQPSILSGARRPDFLCFVPITKLQFQRVAILVDRPGKDPKAVARENRDYENEGYIVQRLLIDRSDPSFSYFKTARTFKNWLETVDGIPVSTAS